MERRGRVIAHVDAPCRDAPITVVVKQDIRPIFDREVRAVGAVAAAFADFYITVIYRYIEGAGKAGTVIVVSSSMVTQQSRVPLKRALTLPSRTTPVPVSTPKIRSVT